MGKIQNLFENKDDTENKISDSQDNETMEWFDENGKKQVMTKFQWKNEILPNLLNEHWNDANYLYNDIMHSIEDGFQNEVKAAAEHLKEIDEIKERGYTILAITYMKCNLYDEARKVLNDYIYQFGKTGIILTNLAKVYYAKNDKRYLDTLWEALNLDPNQSNGVLWYATTFRDSEGTEGYINALNKISVIEGSWFPQILIAKEHLTKRNWDQAKKIYESILENYKDKDEVLITISGDLGQAGYIEEMIKIISPIYELGKYTPGTGLNLLQAYFQTKDFEKGQVLIKDLMKVPDPGLRDYLIHMSNEFDKMRAIKEVKAHDGDVKVNLIVLDSPIWYYQLNDPEWLIRKKETVEKIGLIPYVDLTKKENGEHEVQAEDGIGTLTRTIPLYIGERISFSTNYDENFVIPFAENFGPIVTNKEYNQEALKEISKKIGCDRLITGSLTLKNTTLIVRNYIYDTKTDSIETIIYDLDEECFGEDLNDMVKDVVIDHLGNTSDEASYYEHPSNEEIPAYISALGQQLTQTFIANRYLKREALWGEKDILSWYFNMALKNPKSEVAKIMIASGVTKSKEYGSNLYLEIKEQVVGIFETHKEEKYAKRLLPLIYKVYEMNDEFEAIKEKLLSEENDEKFIKWINNL
ncbi:hypothetical protein NNC19_02785 [Clostridium sp. SHJSY1]|uniref:tetratricopeptide repeat protein n=1 Tax=Clostridium sp. SHJSY1 TaxID=2942483 RepID=UPI002874F468|nr:hypothetical protein [Clostridium sp. SHJSY1]MDS0524588.1 hypothetical protein [Clostridium sp. SHJSY1]